VGRSGPAIKAMPGSAIQAEPPRRTGRDRVRPLVNAKEWLIAYAEKLGVEPPTTEEFKTLLDLAGEAAHACWVAAKAGVDPATALAKAREIDG
jgi:hypothetical protein